MSGALIEMVLAITISGLILGAAILPTMGALLEYRRLEVDLRTTTTHALAASRAEQVAGAIWRDPNGPPGMAPLEWASATQFGVGGWNLRGPTCLEQSSSGGAWSPLTGSISDFRCEYLLNTGVWTSAVPAGGETNVVALRLAWSEAGSGTPHAALVVPRDHAFAAGVLAIPAAAASQPYRRVDCERTVGLAPGDWP